MLIGIVDLDADAIRFSLYKYENGRLRLILCQKAFVGLICYAEAGALSQKGIQKACSALLYFRRVLDELGIVQTFAIARAPLKSISNIDDFLLQAYGQTGFAFELLSGADEARLGFSGAAAENGSGLFAEIGGASTTLAAFAGGQLGKTLSLPYGSLNLSLKYVKSTTPHKSNILDIKQELKRGLKRTGLFSPGARRDILAAGGTAEGARKLYNDVFGLGNENTVMEADKFLGLLSRYIDNRRDITGRLRQLEPDAIHTVIPGLVILHTIVTMSQSGYIDVSCTGVPEAYIRERMHTSASDMSVLISPPRAP
jgi:exopolyphosphatase/guanosine-5'-triphosphate,3'-diphosphate pyrophosphatase